MRSPREPTTETTKTFIYLARKAPSDWDKAMRGLITAADICKWRVMAKQFSQCLSLKMKSIYAAMKSYKCHEHRKMFILFIPSLAKKNSGKKAIKAALNSMQPPRSQIKVQWKLWAPVGEHLWASNLICMRGNWKIIPESQSLQLNLIERYVQNHVFIAKVLSFCREGATSDDFTAMSTLRFTTRHKRQQHERFYMSASRHFNFLCCRPSPQVKRHFM